ncbi:hypothetical protein ACFX19_026017 [Malus domestica]
MEQIKLRNLQRLLDRKPTLDTSLVKFVKKIRSREEFLRSCYDQKIDHLSSDQDLLVGSSTWNEDTEVMRYEYWTAIASVTHLEEIGVQFKCAPLQTCLLNITFNFKKGVMEIPWMKIRANAESLFRNLIAYEQCSLMPRYILSYATMFNQLIKSTKDLGRLIQKGIMDTELSKEDTVFFCSEGFAMTLNVSRSFTLNSQTMRIYIMTVIG